MSISVQLQTIGFMLACGCLMGMGFDTYHVFKNRGRFPRWIVFLLDVLFWLTSIYLVFYVLIKINDGIVRFPVFLGLLAGAWLYFLLGSKNYIQFLQAVIQFSIRLYRLLVRILDLLLVGPIRFLFRIVWMILTSLFSLLIALGRMVWRAVLLLSMPAARLGRRAGRTFRTRTAGIWNITKKWLQLWKRKRK